MKVTLESTATITTITVNGVEVPARIWQGTTAKGIPCYAFIASIACRTDLDNGEFERDLQETHATLRGDLQGIDLRLLID